MKYWLFSCLLVTTFYANDFNDQLSPSARQTSSSTNMFIGADFLYWKADETALYYSQNGKSDGSTELEVGEYDFRGNLQKVKTKWDPGFRVTLGMNLPHDGWDIKSHWTCFSTDAKHTTNENLLMLWAHSDIKHGHYLTRYAHAKWDLNFNIFDIELGRDFFVGKKFSFRPSIGSIGGIVDQKIKINTIYYQSDIRVPEIDALITAHSDFIGGGIKSGLDTSYTFCKSLSFIAKTSYSMLYSRFDSDMKELENNSTNAKTNDHFNLGISSYKISLSFSWDKSFSNKKHFQLQIGWEDNIWVGMNQMNHNLFRYSEGELWEENENLTIQGLILHGQLDF